MSILAQRTFERLSVSEQDERIAHVEKLLKDRRKQSLPVANDRRKTMGRRRKDFADQNDNDLMFAADRQLDEKQD